MSAPIKPSTVAMVTWKALGKWRTEMRFRVLREDVGEVWIGVDGTWIGDATAKDVTPLVVIDPDRNPEGLSYLNPHHFRAYAADLAAAGRPISAAMLRWLAEQLVPFAPADDEVSAS